MVDWTYKDKYDLNDFIHIIDVLRSPGGCPWDIKQTHESLKRNAVEEAYEVCDAIDEGSMEHLREELGDVCYVTLSSDPCLSVYSTKEWDIFCDKLRAFLLVSLIFNDVLSLERPIAVTERGSRGYIYKVISLISEHYRDKLTAANIAAKMGVSRTKLMTDFHRETGFTLADYIMRERVSHARRLLKDGFSVERAEFSETVG